MIKENNNHSEEKGFIKVNGTKHPYLEKTISYDEVLKLAFGFNYAKGANIVYTITWESKPEKKSGTMVEGDVIEVLKGVRFNVKHTNRS